ncbi:flagellar basal body-associated FliL family protein [Rhodospirillaceae bacterium SYSU D60014]|uniref:flagellar basal body-associated FliL family protein n=1 Tax=Virgifigura deserti TaxID=2268457 RepID=UPI0013C4B47B
METAEAYYAVLSKPEGAEAGPVFIDMPPIIANLRHTANGRLIQLGLTLKTSREDRQEAEWLVPHFTETLHDYLRGLDEREIEGSDGMRKLKADLVARAAAIDPDRTIDAVLIQRMVIQ